MGSDDGAYFVCVGGPFDDMEDPLRGEELY
jgi:hypothetical protein